LAVGAVALVVIIAWASIAIAGGGDDQPLTGADLDRAVAAALEHTGGGTATESEVGDDGAAYSVEVRLDDGSQIEVQLDAQFNVLGDEADDDDGPNDVGDSSGDD
jgi:hypothetical protein